MYALCLKTRTVRPFCDDEVINQNLLSHLSLGISMKALKHYHWLVQLLIKLSVACRFKMKFTDL